MFNENQFEIIIFLFIMNAARSAAKLFVYCQSGTHISAGALIGSLFAAIGAVVGYT